MPETEDAVLDTSVLADVSGGDRELIVELVDLYVADAESQFSQLETAAAGVDLDQVGRIAHALKGASASVGCNEASKCFKQLEAMGRTGQSEGLTPSVAEARAALSRAQAALRNLAA